MARGRSGKSLTSYQAAGRRWLPAAAAVVERGASIVEHLRGVSPARLAQFVRRVQLALECLRDVVRGDYREIPWATVGALTVALGYFLAPIDVLPDFIPFLGFVDDAAVFGLVFLAARRYLARYCASRGLNPAEYFD